MESLQNDQHKTSNEFNKLEHYGVGQEHDVMEPLLNNGIVEGDQKLEVKAKKSYHSATTESGGSDIESVGY